MQYRLSVIFYDNRHERPGASPVKYEKPEGFVPTCVGCCRENIGAAYAHGLTGKAMRLGGCVVLTSCGSLDSLGLVQHPSRFQGFRGIPIFGIKHERLA